MTLQRQTGWPVTIAQSYTFSLLSIVPNPAVPAAYLNKKCTKVADRPFHDCKFTCRDIGDRGRSA